jgi:hypothetical protein
MLDPEGFEMHFPEADIRNQVEFVKWYSGVTEKFFDQKHDLKNIEIDINRDTADVSLYINWQAHTWKAPDAHSKFIDSDAFQTWQVVEDKSGIAHIRRYIVEILEDNE